MSHYESKALSRSGLLNCVYRERCRLVALGWLRLGDCRSAERVFDELCVALDRAPQFASLDELRSWCWYAYRNRCDVLLARGGYRQLCLSDQTIARLDDDLRERRIEEILDYGESLRPCLPLLSETGKWVVKFFYFDGKRGLDASRKLNVKPESFYRALERIHSSLAKCGRKRIAMGNLSATAEPARSIEFDRKVFRHLDGQLSHDGLAELERELVEADTRIGEFVDLCIYCSLMRETGSMDLDLDFLERARPAPPTNRAKPWAVSFLAAFSIVGLFSGIFSMIKIGEQASPEASGPPASFVQGSDAYFSGRNVPQSGDTLTKGPYSLARGTIRLEFEKGAKVNIEAPADFTVDSAEAMSLQRGRLLATVPPRAKGFKVATASGTVTDWGTEFGVAVTPELGTDVVVFAGKVEFAPADPRRKRFLRIGEGVRWTAHGGQKLLASQEAFRYPKKFPTGERRSFNDDLVKNGSFESGMLSRAAHSDCLYRDVAALWSPGILDGDSWSPEAPMTAVGTVVRPAGSNDLAPLPDGERCLYLTRAAVRQNITGLLTPGKRYTLSASLARHSPEGPVTSIRVGFLDESGAAMIETRAIEIDSTFQELSFDLTVPGHGDQPLYLVLSSPSGTLFVDDLKLKKISASR